MFASTLTGWMRLKFRCKGIAMFVLQLMPEQMIYCLAWVLVHFVWQGAAIAFLLILIIRLSRIQRPSLRYGMGLLAMLTMALCPVLTLAWLPDFSSDLASTLNALPKLPLSPAACQDDLPAVSSPTRAPSFGATATSGPFDSRVATESETSALPLQEPVLQSLMPFPENQTPVLGLFNLRSVNLRASLWRNMQPWIVTGWLLGVAMFSLRLLLGWIGVWRLCSQVCPVPAWMLERTRILANALRVTLPSIQLSQRITEAVAVGFFKPLILLPVAWITELPADMLDAVIAHELAHIRRGDLWINLLQRMVETLLFYHPAVWWLSRRLRIERELCCDELVVSVTQNRLRYAETLEHIGRLSLARTQSMLAVSINGSRTVLLDRIRHILGLTPHNRSSNVWFAGLIPLLITGLLIGSAAMFRNGTVRAAGETPKEEIREKSGQDDPDVKATAQAVKPSSVVNGFQAFEFHAFESSLHNHVFDVGRMETIDLASRADHETVLHVDRLCRDYGCGDLVWLSSTRQLVGLRGARLLELDIDEFIDIEDVADLSIPDLRKRIEQRGTIAVQLKNNLESDSFVAETREGHLLLLEIEAVDQSSLKVKAQRLTKKEEITFEQPGDGVDQAVWGPITDGLQAGIAYRGGDKSALPSRHFIGELVQVKLFVRNVGKQAQSYSWRRWKANPRIPVQIPVQIPLLDVWQPQINGAKNLQAITGRQKIHDSGERRTVTLQPGEAVLVGATSFSLWPSTEVGFGCYPNRHTSVATSPGRYRLSTELPTQLAGSVPIRTGELDLEVTLPDKEQVNRISQLDGVGHTTNEDFAERWTGWQNARTPRNIRPAAPLAQGEYQAIRCQVYDSKTDQPVAGALAKVSFSARGDQSSDDICEYQTLTDATGYFEMRIPVELLSGFLKGWQTDFRVHVTHPRYSEMFQSETLEHLQQIGLVAADGKLLTPSAPPKLGVALDETHFAKFQSIGLQPARTLSGRFLATDGAPLPNIHIYGSNSQGWPILPAIPQTDSEGRFRFNVPASVTLKLEFRTGKFGRTLITAKPEQTDLGDIKAIAGVKVRGQVLDVKGDPVAYVSVTTPAWPDRLSQPNFIYKTNEKGQFESDVLAPGDYEVEVGSISPPSEDNKPSLSGPPPDLYVPLRITVKAGEPPLELTLRPADSVQITSTLLTTVPKPINDESPQAIDPLYWRVVQEKAKRELEATKPKTPAKPRQAGQPLKLSVDEETGTVVFEGDPQQQQELALNWLQGFSRVPSVTVKGKYRGQDWSRTPNFSELDADPERPKYTCKIPAGLTDVTLEAGDYVQHLQLGSRPKLFGRTLHLDQIGTEPLDLKIYRYRPTTLKVEFVDSAHKPVILQNNTLPAGLVTKARYIREEQVHASGGRFESSESLMHRAILDNSVLHFVIPGEVIDLSITHSDNTEARQLTLQDGETRTVVVELGKGETWTEKTAATLPIKGKQK
jgi:hypothetical protein